MANPYQNMGQALQNVYPGQILHVAPNTHMPVHVPQPIEKVASDEPIVGLRVWKLADDAGLPKLRSVYKQNHVWPYRKAMEKDSLDDAGIHAVKTGIRGPSVMDPAVVHGGIDVLKLFETYEADIAGEVYLWGHVDEHQFGYLAEFAYPKKLFLHDGFDPIVAMQLEDEYGVPCVYRTEFVKKLKEKPKDITPSLAPMAGFSAASFQKAAQQMQQQYQGLQQQAMRNAAGFGHGFWKGLF